VERDEKKRREFIEELESLPEDSELYYADESGFDEYYYREYGYAPRGEKVYGEISGKKFARTSVVAAKRGDEIVAPFAFNGAMTADLFEGWVECVFLPCLSTPHKSVLMIDNATFHNKSRLEDIADEYGFRLLFLPPYSPDFNPIEKFWANIKNRLRLHLRDFDTFWSAFTYAFH